MANKIRVLHCVTSMNRGGLETFIMNYYRHINRDQFSFDFLVQRDGKFDYSDEIARLGGKVYRVPAFNPLRIRKYDSAIDQFFSEHIGEYDIVHAHNNSFAMYVLRAAKKYGYPVRISHSHVANVKFDIIRAPFVCYNKHALKRVCNVRFACGEAAGEWLFGGESFTVIKNAIDTNAFRFDKKKRDKYRKLCGASEETVLIGHVGRFEKQKNHEFLIKLLSSMRSKGIEAKLLLIGDGTLKKPMENMAAKYHLNDRIIFVGVVENPNDYLNAMDVFAMPSFHEGLPVTMIEAQANGLPCIASDKISQECKVTPLVSFLPISQNAISRWEGRILEDSKAPRKDYTEMVDSSGYGINDATKRLEKIYNTLLQKNRIDDIDDMEKKCS